MLTRQGQAALEPTTLDDPTKRRGRQVSGRYALGIHARNDSIANRRPDPQPPSEVGVGTQLRFEHEHSLTSHVLIVARPVIGRIIPSSNSKPTRSNQRANAKIDHASGKQMVTNDGPTVTELHAIIGVVRCWTVILGINTCGNEAAATPQFQNVINEHSTVQTHLRCADTSEARVHDADASKTADGVVPRHFQ